LAGAAASLLALPATVTFSQALSESAAAAAIKTQD
jgi:hypothetical protein